MSPWCVSIPTRYITCTLSVYVCVYLFIVWCRTPYSKLMEQLSICVDVPELSIHAFQVMEEFWKSRQNNKDIMALDKVHVWVVHLYIHTYIHNSCSHSRGSYWCFKWWQMVLVVSYKAFEITSSHFIFVPFHTQSVQYGGWCYIYQCTYVRTYNIENAITSESRIKGNICSWDCFGHIINPPSPSLSRPAAPGPASCRVRYPSICRAHTIPPSAHVVTYWLPLALMWWESSKYVLIHQYTRTYVRASHSYV